MIPSRRNISGSANKRDNNCVSPPPELVFRRLPKWWMPIDRILQELIAIVFRTNNVSNVVRGVVVNDENKIGNVLR